LNTSFITLNNYVANISNVPGTSNSSTGNFSNASVTSILKTNTIQPLLVSDTITLYTNSNGIINFGSNTVTVNIGSSGANASLNVYGPITGNTLTSTSDYRLKENVKYNVSADISRLRPCYYNFINNPENKLGFIAHEVQEIIPQAVVGLKDAVDHDSIVPQRIDYSVITAASVHTIQQLMKKVEELEERIRILESKP